MYLFGDHAADRGLVHADIVGHIAQHERPQVLDAVVEKSRWKLMMLFATL